MVSESKVLSLKLDFVIYLISIIFHVLGLTY
jgi:hypothetical protein